MITGAPNKNKCGTFYKIILKKLDKKKFRRLYSFYNNRIVQLLRILWYYLIHVLVLIYFTFFDYTERILTFSSASLHHQFPNKNRKCEFHDPIRLASLSYKRINYLIYVYTCVLSFHLWRYTLYSNEMESLNIVHSQHMVVIPIRFQYVPIVKFTVLRSPSLLTL